LSTTAAVVVVLFTDTIRNMGVAMASIINVPAINRLQNDRIEFRSSSRGSDQ